MQTSNEASLGRASKRPPAESGGVDRAGEGEVSRWAPLRASVLIIATVVLAMLVWLAYALGWLP